MRNTRTGILALALIGGGYLIWRNRFQIQKLLESYGVQTPILTGDIGEAARSVAAKVGGKVENVVNPPLERKVGNF